MFLEQFRPSSAVKKRPISVMSLSSIWVNVCFCSHQDTEIFLWLFSLQVSVTSCPGCCLFLILNGVPQQQNTDCGVWAVQGQQQQPVLLLRGGCGVLALLRQPRGLPAGGPAWLQPRRRGGGGGRERRQQPTGLSRRDGRRGSGLSGASDARVFFPPIFAVLSHPGGHRGVSEGEDGAGEGGHEEQQRGRFSVVLRTLGFINRD